MTPEGRVKQRVDRLLKRYGVWYFCPVQVGLGKNGIPDRVACVPTVITQEMVGKTFGLFTGIETKADDNETPTDLQRKQLRDIRAAGGVSVLVNMVRVPQFEQLLSHLTGRIIDVKSVESKDRKVAARSRTRRLRPDFADG